MIIRLFLVLLLSSYCCNTILATNFPRVYTATTTTNHIQKETNDDDALFFLASQVDLIGITQKEIANNDSTTASTSTKVSFLVHSLEELNDPIFDSYTLEVDDEQTRDLFIINTNDDYNNANTNIRRKAQQQTSYSTIPGFPCYKSLDGSIEWMTQMTRLSIPSLDITMTDIGDSYLKTVNANEGHDIWALKVTGNSNSVDRSNKGIILLMSGLHARELTPPELVSRWMEDLLSRYNNQDADVIALLDHTEIHIILQTNPDARALVESGNPSQRLRRKNMRTNNGGISCSNVASSGVDLNRNFPFEWGNNSGSSSYPCSQIYRGSSPASEPEVQAIVNYASSIFPEDQRAGGSGASTNTVYDSNIQRGVFVDVHSYGEYMVYPWGNKNIPSGNDLELRSFMNKIRHYNSYLPTGPNQNFSSEASGASDDWSYGVLGTPSFTLELGTSFRDRCFTFENSILEINQRALTYAAKTSRTPLRLPQGPDVTSIEVVEEESNYNTLQIIVEASDSLWSYDTSLSTTRQSVETVKVYLEYPENDLNAEGGQIMMQEGEDDSSSFRLNLDVSNLERNTNIMIYVQATDTDGYTGPVTAAFLPILVDDDPTEVPTTGTPTTKPPTRFPTRLPTRLPTSSPTTFPPTPPPPSSVIDEDTTTRPTTTTTTTSPQPTVSIPIGDFGCFSASQRVELIDGSVRSMSELQIGDVVRVMDGTFEPVYSFGHYAPWMDTTNLFLSINEGALEVSPSHLVLTTSTTKRKDDDENNNNNNEYHWIPAEALQIGDTLIRSSSNGNNDDKTMQTTTIQIYSIQSSNTRQGVYAPFTASGTILVNNGIVASTFISLQPHQEYLHIHGWNTQLSFQWLSHTFESGHRWYGHFFGFSSSDDDEQQYTKDGISHWVAIPHTVMSWTMKQSALLQMLILVPVVSLFLILSVMEQGLILYEDSSSNTMIITLLLLVIMTLFFLGKNIQIRTKRITGQQQKV